MIAFIFFYSHFISHFTTQSTSLLWAITCTHILHKGEVCAMIFSFPFPFESKVDFKYWLRGTLREDILKPDRQRSAYISFDLLIVEVFLAPNHPLFCFPNVLLWKYKYDFSACFLIACSSNYGGGIILTLNNKKVPIACFFFPSRRIMTYHDDDHDITLSTCLLVKISKCHNFNWSAIQLRQLSKSDALLGACGPLVNRNLRQGH